MRFVLDEASLAALAIDEHLDDRLWSLTDLLKALRRAGEEVGVLSSWAAVELADGTDFGQFLYEVPNELRDDARLAASLLDKCKPWDDDPELYVEPDVLLDEVEYVSYGAALALTWAADGRAVGCIAVVGTIEPGLHRVSNDEYAAEIPFVTRQGEEVLVYRRCLLLETANEAQYFEWTEKAFPRLVFAERVSFRHFRGSFQELKETVTEHLCRLNDSFLEVHDEESGDLDVVSTRLGISISNEGSYRTSDSIMRDRDVEYAGEIHRCESHSKLRPDRNRIHFRAIQVNGSRRVVLIGIFTEHLRTAG